MSCKVVTHTGMHSGISHQYSKYACNGYASLFIFLYVTEINHVSEKSV